MFADCDKLNDQETIQQLPWPREFNVMLANAMSVPPEDWNPNYIPANQPPSFLVIHSPAGPKFPIRVKEFVYARKSFSSESLPNVASFGWGDEEIKEKKKKTFPEVKGGDDKWAAPRRRSSIPRALPKPPQSKMSSVEEIPQQDLDPREVYRREVLRRHIEYMEDTYGYRREFGPPPFEAGDEWIKELWEHPERVAQVTVAPEASQATVEEPKEGFFAKLTRVVEGFFCVTRPTH
uniref:Tas, oxidoreductase (Related to aryl-alcohol dehydrogenase) n=1 Tax=Caenorhabditis tropicalis TaxID=1561998 RepID=A0A1I7UIE0_9PELO